jgi:hypothetical protein
MYNTAFWEMKECSLVEVITFLRNLPPSCLKVEQASFKIRYFGHRIERYVLK